MNSKNFSLVLVILIAALSRLIPHAPNFTPIIAIGLFSGFYFRGNKTLAILLPLAAMRPHCVIQERAPSNRTFDICKLEPKLKSYTLGNLKRVCREFVRF